MKKIIFITVCCIVSSMCCFAKKNDKVSRPLDLDTVIAVPGIDKVKIYEGVKVWFANVMRSSNAVIQLDDKEAGRIIGKANLDFPVRNISYSSLSGHIDFSIEVQCRDGRFRLKMYNFDHVSESLRYPEGWSEGPVYVEGIPQGHGGLRKNQYNQMRKRAVPMLIDEMALIIVSLQKYINDYKSNENDNW